MAAAKFSRGHVDQSVAHLQSMTYIVQRKDRFYVVAYDGLDPLTGLERHRWHPAGCDRDEAEALEDAGQRSCEVCRVRCRSAVA